MSDAIASQTAKRLINAKAPNGFPFESLPPQGYVELTYDDGSTETRLMDETQFHALTWPRGAE
jgi:hypothetical protein